MVTEGIHIQNENKDIRHTVNDIVAHLDEENPLFVCDINDIIRKCKIWKELLPRVKPHYAVKCNHHPVVLKVLAAMGIGFDCSTKQEIEKVLKLNVKPEHIIFAHTTKQPSHIRYAVDVNVNLMTFDNEIELHKIKKLAPNAKAVIRIKYDSQSATCVFGDKFGCDYNLEAAHLLEVAHSLGIDVVGVSFHVGSGCNDPLAFHGAIAAARYVFDVASKIGYNFSLLDIGGGYPGHLDDKINKYAKIINSALDEFFPDDSVEIISEPGLYFVHTAFTLICNVFAVKKIVDKDSVSGEMSTQYMYYINEGVYGSFSGVVLYKDVRIPEPLKEHVDEQTYPSTLWGPTCDITDRIIGNIQLPEMQVGDWVYFPDMGSYTLSCCSQFSSFPQSKVYSIINPNNWSLLHNKFPFVKSDFCIEADLHNGKNMKINPHLEIKTQQLYITR